MTRHIGAAGPETEREYESMLGRRIERRLSRDAPVGFVVRCDVLCFRMLYNHPHRTNDVGGAFAPEACYFTYYNNLAYDHIHIIDNGDANARDAADRRADVLQVLDEHPEGELLSAVVFFCHGWAHGCQMGFTNDTLTELVEKLAAKCRPDVRIILYACGTASSPEEESLTLFRRGKTADELRDARDDIEAREAVIAAQAAGEGGFAFTLRDLLAATNPDCQVIGHVTTGHATRNPDVRRFSAPAGSGGVRPIPHGTGPRRTHGDEVADPSHELWRRWAFTLANAFDDERPSALLWHFPFMTDAEIRTHLADLYGDPVAAADAAPAAEATDATEATEPAEPSEPVPPPVDACP
jgi:hypothetical protein